MEAGEVELCGAWAEGGRGGIGGGGEAEGGKGGRGSREPTLPRVVSGVWARGADEETRVCPSLLRVKRVQAVTGESDHTSLRVARLLVDGGEADHGHPGLQLILALVPLPLVLLAEQHLATIDLVRRAVGPARGPRRQGLLGRRCRHLRACCTVREDSCDGIRGGGQCGMSVRWSWATWAPCWAGGRVAPLVAVTRAAAC